MSNFVAMLVISFIALFALVAGDQYCKDTLINGQCSSLKKHCSKPWISRPCPVTCGICHICQDTTKERICIRYRSKGQCYYVKYFCRKTCGYCTGTATTASPPLLVTTAVLPGTQAPAPPCGMPSVAQSRVIGGHDAKPGAWPWQIALLRSGRFTCGGSLVTPQWVVTAAHCVSRYGTYQVRLGVQDLWHEENSWQTIPVEKVISHPGYFKLNNDIALVKLSKPAMLNDRVRTVCLPKNGQPVPTGTKCFITGFGKVRHPGIVHPILQQADLLVVNQSTCAALNTKRTGIQITSQMVCGGYGPSNVKSGCHGDSGGPFVCQYGNGNAFTLHGAVSWGSPRCNTKESYTVFARVTALLPWIRGHIGI